jgi:hypothetical protein
MERSSPSSQATSSSLFLSLFIPDSFSILAFSGIVSQILLFIFLLLLLSAVAGFKRLPGSNCCSERPKRRTEEEEDEDLHF